MDTWLRRLCRWADCWGLCVLVTVVLPPGASLEFIPRGVLCSHVTSVFCHVRPLDARHVRLVVTRHFRPVVTRHVRRLLPRHVRPLVQSRVRPPVSRLVGPNSAFVHFIDMSELRSCVKVEVVVLGSPPRP